ncbi:hypothetical protein MPSEU_000006300 [Mayamaea pseudoterrestris]|nr:hypothetical protein MPSEU_000006300 [Mayamaea pseudoterrestris]
MNPLHRLALCLFVILLPATQGFSVSPSTTFTTTAHLSLHEEPSRRIRSYSLQGRYNFVLHARNDEKKDLENVKVNLIPDVDATTLTAIGFGLIAFNFFVLANLGDGVLQEHLQRSLTSQRNSRTKT